MTRKRLMVRLSISTVPRCTFSARAQDAQAADRQRADGQGSNG